MSIYELHPKIQRDIENIVQRTERLHVFEENVKDMIRRDLLQIRQQPTCYGCSHEEHEPGLCLRVPLFTNEKRCGCPCGPDTGAAA